MITPVTIKVILFASRRHLGQMYGKYQYTHHLDSVYDTYNYLFGIPDEQTTMVIYCHDLLEDTNTNLDDLGNLGLEDDSLNAVLLLTKSRGSSNEEYLEGVGTRELAIKVKIADSTSNLIHCLQDGKDSLVKKYTNNLKILWGYLK